MVPIEVYTYDHHVIVDLPRSSGSIPERTLVMNFVMNLGCSLRLLKKRKTAF
jgi:hypothetical protein